MRRHGLEGSWKVPGRFREGSEFKTYEAAWPPIGPPRTRTLGNHGAMPKRSSCSGLAAKQVVVVGERGRAPFHLAGCLGAQELSHCTPSSTHLLCCRVAIARWLRCDPPCAFSISITVPCTPVGGWGSDSRIGVVLSGGGGLRSYRIPACKRSLIFASGERPEHHSGTACPVRPGRSDGNAKPIAFTLQARSIRVKGPERFRRSLPVHSALAPAHSYTPPLIVTVGLIRWSDVERAVNGIHATLDRVNDLLHDVSVNDHPVTYESAPPARRRAHSPHVPVSGMRREACIASTAAAEPRSSSST